MRKTVRRFLPLFLAVGAIVAAVAFPVVALSATCRTGDSCASLEHNSTADAKKFLPVDGSGNSLVSGGLKSVIVDTSGDSAVDATANAVKTVDVDNAGTLLVGGRGSRVELLASGTDTTITATTTLFTTTTTPLPAWCHSVIFSAQIATITGAPSNFYVYAGGLGANGAIAGSGVWTQSITVASPLANQTGWILMGREYSSGSAGALGPSGGGGNVVGAFPFLPRSIEIKRSFTATPATLSMPWTLHCIGG
jgi:hypothetical protein